MVFIPATEIPDDARQLLSYVKGSNSFVSRHAGTVIEIIRQAKEQALREVEESRSELEEGEVEEESLREDLVVDDMNDDGPLTAQMKETVLEVRRKSPDEDQEGKVETSFSFATLQTESAAMPSVEAGPSSVRTPGRGTLVATEATGRDRAGDSLPDARSEESQSKLKSEVSTGPVVVSRRTSSSLFGRKSQRPSPVPLPPSSVLSPKELGGISEARDSPAALLTGPSLLTGGFSLRGVDQVMSDAFTVDDGRGDPLNEGQASDEAHKETSSEGNLTAGTAATSMEIQAAGQISSLTVEPVDRESDTNSIVPETPQVTLREGESPEVGVSPTSLDDHVPASAVIQKLSERPRIIEAKRKPSRLGSLLGGRKRVHQFVPLESANEVEDVLVPCLDEILCDLFLVIALTVNEHCSAHHIWLGKQSKLFIYFHEIPPIYLRSAAHESFFNNHSIISSMMLIYFPDLSPIYSISSHLKPACLCKVVLVIVFLLSSCHVLSGLIRIVVVCSWMARVVISSGKNEDARYRILHGAPLRSPSRGASRHIRTAAAAAAAALRRRSNRFHHTGGEAR